MCRHGMGEGYLLSHSILASATSTLGYSATAHFYHRHRGRDWRQEGESDEGGGKVQGLLHGLALGLKRGLDSAVGAFQG